ncbi:MAG TPA: glycosyltransferase family 39 protein [Clostridia bacterium]|nr:glycosyltransferase family 39 protein [Clostridia bacterium]
MIKILSILKKNWLIFLIIALALGLRLYRLPSYMTFLGDEGRDALVWLRMTRGKLTLIGPQTSIGNMYLGPLFYYLMLPFYLLLGTAGPSIGMALFGGGTTFLLWFVGKEWFSQKVGLLAAFLYALSPVAIVLSRSAWNPNIMPFFALLSVWGVWQFWQEGNFIWLAAEGVLLSFAVQSHYLGLLLVPFVGAFFIIKLISLKKTKAKKLKKFLIHFALCLLAFVVLTILPLVWFDLRHQFINYQAFYKFFSERQTTVDFKAYKAIPNLWPLWQMLVSRFLTGKNAVAGFWISVLLLISTAFSVYLDEMKKKARENKQALFLICSWLLVGLIGMGLYKQHIYDHYFGFLFPTAFLLVALTLEKIWELGKMGRVFAFLIFFLLLGLSLAEIPLRYPPNQQMQRTAEISKKIIEYSGGKSFNLGMIAKQNYDAGYRYFLEKWGYQPLSIDAQKAASTITQQLFVVCEEEVCQPIGHPQAEIANFGWAKLDKEWEFSWEVKLYRLVHND